MSWDAQIKITSGLGALDQLHILDLGVIANIAVLISRALHQLAAFLIEIHRYALGCQILSVQVPSHTRETRISVVQARITQRRGARTTVFTMGNGVFVLVFVMEVRRKSQRRL
jgi:hypothetical protein